MLSREEHNKKYGILINKWNICSMNSENDKLSRPALHLRRLNRLYPKAKEITQKFKDGLQEKQYPDFPKYSFLHPDVLHAIIAKQNSIPKDTEIPEMLDFDFNYLGGLLGWSYSQGIYKFDENVFEELSEADLSGELPGELLHSLPEWTVYIETPNSTWPGHTGEVEKLYGFFASIQHWPHENMSNLIILLDTESSLVSRVIELKKWTISEAIERNFQYVAQKIMTDTGEPLEEIEPDLLEWQKYFIKLMSSCISLLLYVCSEEPDIKDETKCKEIPAYPKTKKVKGVMRYILPEKPRLWKVGEKLGEEFREAKERSNNFLCGATRTITPHIRRAHWHRFWTGPRTGERKLVPKLIHPLLVRARLENKEVEASVSI